MPQPVPSFLNEFDDVNRISRLFSTNSSVVNIFCDNKAEHRRALRLLLFLGCKWHGEYRDINYILQRWPFSDYNIIRIRINTNYLSGAGMPNLLVNKTDAVLTVLQLFQHYKLNKKEMDKHD